MYLASCLLFCTFYYQLFKKYLLKTEPSNDDFTEALNHSNIYSIGALTSIISTGYIIYFAELFCIKKVSDIIQERSQILDILYICLLIGAVAHTSFHHNKRNYKKMKEVFSEKENTLLLFNIHKKRFYKSLLLLYLFVGVTVIIILLIKGYNNYIMNI